jgi:hypothetical protein
VDVIYLGGLPAGSCGAGFQYNAETNDWFSYNDGTSARPVAGQQPGGCDNSQNCAYHITGSGYTGYGAGAGITLNANAVFDASAYSGLEVWFRGTARGTRGPWFTAMDDVVHVKFVTTAPNGTGDPRDGDDYGGFCEISGDAASCYMPCVLPFAALSREGLAPVDSGAPDPASDVFDPQNLVKIMFDFSSYTSTDPSAVPVPVSFDVWIDLIEWLPQP